MISRARLQSVSVVLLATWLFASPVNAGFWQESITLEQWQAYGEGKEIIRMDAIREMIGLFREASGYQIVVRHPGGEAGTQWGRDLVEWLVAIGIPSSYIQSAPGSGGLNILHLSLAYPD